MHLFKVGLQICIHVFNYMTVKFPFYLVSVIHINRESYMSARVLMNLLNKLGKR